MIPLNTLLGRIALQLTGMADRLSVLTLADAEGAREIVALQGIDYLEQMSRSLASVVATLSGSAAATGAVEADALLAGLPLDELRLSLAGIVATLPADCEMELF